MATPRRAGRPRNPVPRERLLEVARDAFAELGYAGASMSEIAGRADIRKSSLFHHFATKDALYLEAVGATLAPLGVLVVEAATGEGSFGERLDRLGEAVSNYLGSHRQAARLLVREVLDRGPFVAGEGRGAVQALLQTIRDFLAQGMADGLIPRRDPDHLTLTIIATHLFYFAAEPLVEGLSGRDLFDGAAVRQRREAVLSQIRALVGLPIAEDPATTG